jgi:hypothetical protein
MAPFQVRPGDVAITETASRNKAGIEYFYICEAIVAVKDDVATSAGGNKMSNICAIYRPGLAKLNDTGGALIVPRDAIRYDTKALVKALNGRFGLGELITGFACDRKACGLKK